MTNVEEPPRKRQRRDVEGEYILRIFFGLIQIISVTEDAIRALLLEEIDHEIALRTRLQETVQSRLTWALILQETLEKQLVPPNSEGVHISLVLLVTSFYDCTQQIQGLQALLS